MRSVSPCLLAEMPKWPLRKCTAAPPAAAADRRRRAATAGPATGPHGSTSPTIAGRRPPPPPQGTPPKKRQRTGADDPLALLGPATETKAEHQKRHGVPGLQSCARCRWYAMGDRWSKTVGAFSGPSVPQKRCWIAERPARWGGTWGLGCSLCSLSLNRSRTEDQGGVSRVTAEPARRQSTKWARYEVRPAVLQAETFAQHRASDIHKVALHGWMYPDEPVKLKLQASDSDDRLLSGAVPQVEDWLRAWRAARAPQSWQVAAEKARTEHFIRPSRDRPTGTRPLEHMALIMQETIRQKKRAAIADASSISLAFDDRKGFKLVRFRCDAAPSLNSRGRHDAGGAEPSAQPAVGGILGVVQCLRGSSMADFAEDYAERTVGEIRKMIDAFCTPLGGVVDASLVAKFQSTVRAVVADGALQKVAQYLQRSCMPNIVLIARDPAHMLRIAAKEPFVRSSRFGRQHERLFGKGGLLRQVQFSDGLQARLEECQRIVLRQSGVQGGDLRHVMRHFSFAAHRFESLIEPRRKYACVLHAVVLLLADIAGDSRRTVADRKQAEEALDAMTTQDLLETGLAGDFAEVALRALRRFDQADPDPALASFALADFADQARRLFIDGWVLMDPDEPELKTLTQIVLEQCCDIRQFRYGERVKVLWTKTTKDEVQETLREIATIVGDMLDRLKADFGSDDMYMQLQCMHVEAAAFALHQGQASAKHVALRRCARNWHVALGLAWCATDWDLVVAAAARVRSQEPGLDNRVVWARVLSLPGLALADRRAIERSEKLIRFYLSLSDGTGAVERQLGRHAAFLDCHGPGALSEACLEIVAEGPEVETDVATKSDGQLLLTACSRQWAELWVGTRGRRFGVYKLRADAGQRSRLRFHGSLRAVQVGTRAALDSLVRKARSDTTPAALDRRRTVVGHRRGELLTGAAARAAAPQSKRLASFRKVTADRVKAKKAVGLWRGFDRKLPPARPKTGGRLPHMVAAPRADPRRAVSALAKPQSQRPQATASTPSPAPTIAVAEDLPAAPLTAEVLKAWVPAVAEGKTVVVRSTKTCINFKSTMKTSVKFRLSPDFASKHRALSAELRRIVANPTSKWAEVGSGGVEIRDLRGLRSFLVQVQRRPFVCGVAGLAGKMPAKMLGRVSRYGRPVAA